MKLLLIIALIASSFAEVAVRNFDLLDNCNNETKTQAWSPISRKGHVIEVLGGEEIGDSGAGSYISNGTKWVKFDLETIPQEDSSLSSEVSQEPFNGAASTWSEGVVSILEPGGNAEVAINNNNPTKSLSPAVTDVRSNQRLLIRENVPASSTVTVSFNPEFLLKSDFASVIQFRAKMFYVLAASNGRAGHVDYYYQRFSTEILDTVYERHEGVSGSKPTVNFVYVSNTQVDVKIVNNFGKVAQVSILINH